MKHSLKSHIYIRKASQRLPAALYLVLSLLLAVSCKNQADENTPQNATELSLSEGEIYVTKTQFKEMGMQFISPDSVELHREVNTKGMIDVPPQNSAVVSPKIGGFIAQTTLLVGDKVRQGQAVFMLTHPDYVELQQNFLEVKSQLEFLKTEYERQKSLMDEKITSEKNYLKAKSDYNTALASYNGFAQKLRLLNINPDKLTVDKISDKIVFYAPISGTVTRVNIQLGQLVSPSFEAMEIVNLDHLHLELNVYEKDILSVRVGQLVKFTLPEISDKTFDARIHLVGQSLDNNSRTVKVHAHLTDENQNFIRGMYVDAVIAVQTFKALTLPKTSVVSLEEDSYVLKLVKEDENGFVFLKLKVEAGLEDEEIIEIKNSVISVNDQILGKGAYQLVQPEI